MSNAANPSSPNPAPPSRGEGSAPPSRGEGSAQPRVSPAPAPPAQPQPAPTLAPPPPTPAFTATFNIPEPPATQPKRPPRPAREPREAHQPPPPIIPPAARVKVAVLAVLFVALFADILLRLGRFAWTDGDWSHAFLVPIFSLFFLHQQRDRLAKETVRAWWPGLLLLLGAVAGYFWAIAAGNDMLKGYSMIAALFGLVLHLAGPGVMKVAWFPILYLVFAVKVNHELWESIAWNLQLIAAKGATFVLALIGIDALVTETTIEMFRGAERIGALNVAEACSGMRMLMTFIALGVAVAYMWDRPAWTRLVMVLLTVPIAVLVNIGRVTLLAVLYQVDAQYAAGDFHIFMGMLMLGPALALFLLTGWVLGFITPDEEGAPA